MARPSLRDVECYLDQLADEQAETRRLLEDLANIEDGPETDEVIRAARLADRLDA